MASIQLEGVVVDFSIRGVSAGSLKQTLIAASTGGRIGNVGSRTVNVRALDGVTLRLNHGDRVALVGHNGAGKSTFLRVLAGIYEPTVGSACVQGRVVPLLSNSLGLETNNTGRQNIILRGLLLGMSKAEIEEKVEEIAEFTELGEFLEMPLSAYSAGMRARLAFAISTASNPEILLLDESIGAGDASFVEKAKERMNQFIARSSILVLASHSDELLRKLCTRALLFEKGKILMDGGVEDVLEIYSAQRKERRRLARRAQLAI